MKRVEIVTTILFLIVFAATLLVFFLGFPSVPKENAYYAALIFVLLAETALFMAIRLISGRHGNGGRVFLASGVLTTLTFYWAVTVVFAFLAAPLYVDHLKGLFPLEFFALAAATVLVAIFVATAGHYANRAMPSASGAELSVLAEKIRGFIADPRCAPHKKGLCALYDELTNADKRASIQEMDEALIQAVCALEALLFEGADGATQAVESARLLAKRRNLATLKSGAEF
jgi:hypothetical protein